MGSLIDHIVSCTCQVRRIFRINTCRIVNVRVVKTRGGTFDRAFCNVKLRVPWRVSYSVLRICTAYFISWKYDGVDKPFKCRFSFFSPLPVKGYRIFQEIPFFELCFLSIVDFEFDWLVNASEAVLLELEIILILLLVLLILPEGRWRESVPTSLAAFSVAAIFVSFWSPDFSDLSWGRLLILLLGGDKGDWLRSSFVVFLPDEEEFDVAGGEVTSDTWKHKISM